MMPENIFFIFLVTVFGLCWGSFLNVIAHRLLCNTSPLSGRSHCPTCEKTIAWYDLIPVLSWLYLRAKCRICKSPISLLYPFIEIITATSFIGLTLFVPAHYWPVFFFYISALIVTIRTDIAELVIMRQMTLFIIPFTLLAAYFGFAPISLYQALLGGTIGAGVIAFTSFIFWTITKKIGLGQGDIELCALIGASTGIVGWWVSLMIGSLSGTFIGLYLIIFKPKNILSNQIKLPFGALLAIGSIIFVVYQIPIQHGLAKLLLVV